jgi:hypothetical protein
MLSAVVSWFMNMRNYGCSMIGTRHPAVMSHLVYLSYFKINANHCGKYNVSQFPRKAGQTRSCRMDGRVACGSLSLSHWIRLRSRSATPEPQQLLVSVSSFATAAEGA